MKYMVPLVSILILNLACGTSQSASNERLDSNKEVYYSIGEVTETDIIRSATEPPGKWKTKENEKFVLIEFSLVNPTNEKVAFTYNDIFLYDPNTDTDHGIKLLMSHGIVVADKKLTESEIGKKSTMKRTLVFIFPKNEKVKFLKKQKKLIELNL